MCDGTRGIRQPCLDASGSGSSCSLDQRRLEMQRLADFLMRHRLTIRDCALLLATLGVGTLLALEYDLYENVGTSPIEHAIEFVEALRPASRVCIGRFLISLRLMVVQRREMRHRAAAERRARERALEDALTGLPNRRRFDNGLTAAAAASAGTSCHAVL